MYLYTITCCGRKIDIYRQSLARCEGCGTTFEPRADAPSTRLTLAQQRAMNIARALDALNYDRGRRQIMLRNATGVWNYGPVLVAALIMDIAEKDHMRRQLRDLLRDQMAAIALEQALPGGAE